MPGVYSFAPVAAPKAATLLLGSMPGRASLEAGRYYAHPRNAFWRIITDALGSGAAVPYPARLRLLKKNRIALWDVLYSCVRPGSADSDIKRSSVKPNDFKAFFRRHPGIKLVFFNGAKAEELFRKYVLPSLPASCASIKYRRLPSTSPAHASLVYSRKLKIWRSALLK